VRGTARLVPSFRVRHWLMASITETIADDRNLVLKSPTRIWGNRVGKTAEQKQSRGPSFAALGWARNRPESITRKLQFGYNFGCRLSRYIGIGFNG
jgi:hypothetical protein